MDSGLIFPIIILLWAAYLVPQWIRRREQLSASRAVGRFSAATRVLSRRSSAEPAPRPAGRGYVLPPANVPGAGSGAPVPAGLSAPAGSSVTVEGVDGSSATSEVSAPRVVVKRASTAMPADVPVSGGRRSRVPGLLVLAALVALPVTALLAVTGRVPVWSVAVPLVVGAVALAVVRRAAVRRRRLAARAAAAARVEEPVPVRRPVRADVRARIPAQREAAPAQDVLPAAGGVGDGSWTPVPVPPPTYTLKPAAPRRAVAAEHTVPAAPVRARVASAGLAASAATAASIAGASAASQGASASEPSQAAPASGAQQAADVAREGSQRPSRRGFPDLDVVLERRRASGE